MKISFTQGDRKKIVLLAIFTLGVLAGLVVAALMARQAAQDATPVAQLGAVTVYSGDLPTLRGEGDLPDLHTVAADDPALQAMLANMVAAPSIDLLLNLEATDRGILAILFRWAGVDAIAQDANGPYIDGRIVSFLARAGVVGADVLADPRIGMGPATTLRSTWARGYNHYRIRLLSQTLGRDVYGGNISYDSRSDEIKVAGPLSQDFLKRLETTMQSMTQPAPVIRHFLDFVEATAGFDGLSDEDRDRIMALSTTPNGEAQ